MKVGKKIINGMMLVVVAMAILGAPITASADVGNLNTDIYKKTEDNILADKVEQIVKIVGGVGGVGFVLAVLIIALCIIFGSISSQQIGTWWKALFSCLAGAFIFFSAYAFAPAIAQLAQG